MKYDFDSLARKFSRRFLKVGDVLMLDQSQDKPLKLRIEHSEKYRVEPVERSGVISVRVVEPILKPPVPEPNKSYK